jgi:hypothetical protein
MWSGSVASPVAARRRSTPPGGTLVLGILAVLALAPLPGCAPEEETPIVLIDDDADGWPLPQDCDDTIATVHPGATERCDTVDEDCDGVADDAPVDGLPGWHDRDGDGWGDPATRGTWCPGGDVGSTVWVSIAGDCDDGDATRFPNATESCVKAGDDDCDGNDNDPGALGCAAWYADVDGDGVGGTDEACLCDAEGVYRAALAGDCDDADATVSSGCGSSGATTTAEADVVVYGDRSARAAGAAVAGVGDLDGDGYPDLLVAGGDTRLPPRWWVMRGPFATDRDLAAPTAELSDPTLLTTNGVVVAGGADLDGDGAADLVLAAHGLADSATGPRDTGAVYVIRGSVTGTVDLADADAGLTGTTGPTDLALSGATVDDTDGDGRGDLLVGYGGSATILLLRGPVTGTLAFTDADLVVTAGSDSGFGAAVAPAGDLDGDGLADLLVGAPASRAADGDGAAWILPGGATGTLAVADIGIALAGPDRQQHAGFTVAAAGDVDGDGHADVLVGGGSPFDTEGTVGVVWLVRGPVAAAAALDDAEARIDGTGPGDRAGFVAAAGDLDGDARADVVIGAPGADDSAAQAGAAFVFHGPLAGRLGTGDADLRVYGLAGADAAGTAATGVGDLDLDGFDDLAVGAPGSDLGGPDAGAVFLFLGGA